MRETTLFGVTSVTVRVRQLWRRGPVMDLDGHVVGSVFEWRGLHFTDEDNRFVVHVKHSTGLTAFGADRWRMFDASRNQIGSIDKEGDITLGTDKVGSFKVDWYRSGVVMTSGGIEIAKVSQLPKEGFLDTYGYRWRLDTASAIDRSLKMVSLACLGGLILAHNADSRVG